MDLARLLLDIDRKAIFPGQGKVMRQRIADTLTEVTGRKHVLFKKPSGVFLVREADPTER